MAQIELALDFLRERNFVYCSMLQIPQHSHRLSATKVSRRGLQLCQRGEDTNYLKLIAENTFK